MYAELAEPSLVPGRPKVITFRNTEAPVEYATIAHEST